MLSADTREAPARWLGEAIDEAVRGVHSGRGGPFGALVVREGVVLGRAPNQVTSLCDPTAHAEVLAIREACRALGEFALRGATLYASCEPCPMCLSAACWARVDRVWFAATRFDAAQAGFDDARLHDALGTRLDALPMPVEHRAHARAGEPFAAWLELATRVPY